MINLIDKVVNCYLAYLKRLNYGDARKPSSLLYNAILYLKSGIDNDQYTEYFYNNLKCPKTITLTDNLAIYRTIAWALSSSEELLTSFTFTETDTPTLRSYTLTTTSLVGFNYIYISVPQDVEFIITDVLGNTLFNSTIAPAGQSFSLAGTTTTSEGLTNSVYKSNDVFNTYNPVTYIVTLF